MNVSQKRGFTKSRILNQTVLLTTSDERDYRLTIRIVPIIRR